VKRIIFISGHLDLTLGEFLEHYAPRIDDAVRDGAEFVVGDARGTDVLAQGHLGGLGVVATVFHMFDRPRNNPYGFLTKGGFRSDEERDAAMTKASTEDLAWVRPGRKKSGTAKNIRRRANGC
jgi:hypothetical protein